MKKVLIGIIAVIILFSLTAVRVFAATTPTFPTCVNPQGTQSVSYDSGTHGIVGDSSTHTGSDAVYTLSDQSLMQCFCDLSGNGMQTNWLKADGYSADDIHVLESEGWIYVPDGSAWGLNAVPYLAHNLSFACEGGSNSNGGSSSSNGGSSNSNGGSSSNSGSNSSNSSSSPSSSSSNSTGSVLAASTGPGLAYTGNLEVIISVLGLGILAMISGFALSFNREGVTVTVPHTKKLGKKSKTSKKTSKAKKRIR